MTKKLFSFLMIVTLLVSSISSSVFANDTETIEPTIGIYFADVDIEEIPVEFFIDLEVTEDGIGIAPFATYWDGADISYNISGTKLSYSYDVYCYNVDDFDITVNLQRSSTKNSWTTMSSHTKSTTKTYISSSISTSTYDSSYYYRLQIKGTAYINNRSVETCNYESSAI